MTSAEHTRKSRVVDRSTNAGRITIDTGRPRQEPSHDRAVAVRTLAKIDGRVVIDDDVVVINPPTLVPDPYGEVVLVVGVDKAGEPIEQRFRHDPQAALAEVLTQLAERAANRTLTKRPL